MGPPMHQPVVITDGGPWADHDVACPVCRERKAVLFLNEGVFWPCDVCRRIGWRLWRVPRWLRRFAP